MNEKTNQNTETVQKTTRNRKKVNVERKAQVINHYADISESERFGIGVRLFEMLGLLVPNEE